MQIKLISDLHTEFSHKDQRDETFEWLPNEGIDTLIVAGDLSTGFKKRIKPNLKAMCDRFPNVIYVLGNHDCWYSSLEKRYEQLSTLDAKISNLHWLENRAVTIDNERFIGGTLWFPRQVNSKNSWVDYRLVEDGYETISAAHEKTKKYLEDNVREGDIMVTHHLPSYQCVAPRWVGEFSNCFFVAL